MKSTLIRMDNLEDSIRRWPWNVQIDDAKIQESLYQAALPYASYVEADTVQAADILTVEMKSAIPNTSKHLPLGHNKNTSHYVD